MLLQRVIHLLKLIPPNHYHILVNKFAEDCSICYGGQSFTGRFLAGVYHAGEPSRVIAAPEMVTAIVEIQADLSARVTCLQVLRYLRSHRNVLHRDISSGNVMYVKDSSNRSLPWNTPAQEVETNGLPLCYSKKLLGERYLYLEAEIG